MAVLAHMDTSTTNSPWLHCKDRPELLDWSSISTLDKRDSASTERVNHAQLRSWALAEQSIEDLPSLKHSSGDSMFSVGQKSRNTSGIFLGSTGNALMSEDAIKQDDDYINGDADEMDLSEITDQDAWKPLMRPIQATEEVDEMICEEIASVLGCCLSDLSSISSIGSDLYLMPACCTDAECDNEETLPPKQPLVGSRCPEETKSFYICWRDNDSWTRTSDWVLSQQYDDQCAKARFDGQCANIFESVKVPGPSATYPRPDAVLL